MKSDYPRHVNFSYSRIFKLTKHGFPMVIKKKSKQGQMKIMEMSFMIIGLVVFFVIVGMFVLLITTSSFRQKANEAKQENAILLVSKIADSPEFSCGETLCVDTDKLIVLKNSSAYRSYWADISGLVVKRIYPETNKGVECYLVNYPQCDTYTIMPPKGNVSLQSSYVNLCRREYKNGYPYEQCELGKIIAYLKVI